jgi:hypothetical protein
MLTPHARAPAGAAYRQADELAWYFGNRRGPIDMFTNGKTTLQIRRPILPELQEMREDVRDIACGMWDTRWPLQTRRIGGGSAR